MTERLFRVVAVAATFMSAACGGKSSSSAPTAVTPTPSVNALLDVYQVIGRDAMARAYRTIQPLRPPYGQVLSDACKQAFVDQAPEARKAQVAAIVQRVTY